MAPSVALLCGWLRLGLRDAVLPELQADLDGPPGSARRQAARLLAELGDVTATSADEAPPSLEPLTRDLGGD